MEAGGVGKHAVKIGVGVEGISDKYFLEKLFEKHAQKTGGQQKRNLRFDIRPLNGKEKLISKSDELLRNFRVGGYRAGIILLDGDGNIPGCEINKMKFEDFLHLNDVNREIQLNFHDRFLHIVYAVKEIESWYLADAAAINKAIPGAGYVAPEDTSSIGKKKLKELFDAHLPGQGYKEPVFAKLIAPKFDPERAIGHSPSFKLFWRRFMELTNQIA